MARVERLQAKLDSIAQWLRQHFNDAGRKLIYDNGCWRVLENSEWRPLDKLERADFDRLVSQLCTDAGLSPKGYRAMVHRHLRSSWEFAPPRNSAFRDLRQEV